MLNIQPGDQTRPGEDSNLAHSPVLVNAKDNINLGIVLIVFL